MGKAIGSIVESIQRPWDLAEIATDWQGCGPFPDFSALWKIQGLPFILEAEGPILAMYKV